MSNSTFYLDLLPDVIEYPIPRYETLYSKDEERGKELWSTKKYEYYLSIRKTKREEDGKMVYVIRYEYRDFGELEQTIPCVSDEEILKDEFTSFSEETGVYYFLSKDDYGIDEDIDKAAKKVYDWLVEKGVIKDEQ